MVTLYRPRIFEGEREVPVDGPPARLFVSPHPGRPPKRRRRYFNGWWCEDLEPSAPRPVRRRRGRPPLWPCNGAELVSAVQIRKAVNPNLTDRNIVYRLAVEFGRPTKRASLWARYQQERRKLALNQAASL